MTTDTSTRGIQRGKMLWGAGELPSGATLLGTVRREERLGAEALILLPTGVTVGGKWGSSSPLYEAGAATGLTCLRCGYTWRPRASTLPRKCPRCNSPYWNRQRLKDKGQG